MQKQPGQAGQRLRPLFFFLFSKGNFILNYFCFSFETKIQCHDERTNCKNEFLSGGEGSPP